MVEFGFLKKPKTDYWRNSPVDAYTPWLNATPENPPAIARESTARLGSNHRKDAG